jgi:hypothetical protein
MLPCTASVAAASTAASLGEGARLEQLHLGFEELEAEGIQPVELLDGHHRRCLALQQQGGLGLVDRREGVGPQAGKHADDQHQPENAPLALPDDQPELQQVDFVAVLVLPRGQLVALDDLCIGFHAGSNSEKGVKWMNWSFTRRCS